MPGDSLVGRQRLPDEQLGLVTERGEKGEAVAAAIDLFDARIVEQDRSGFRGHELVRLAQHFDEVVRETHLGLEVRQGRASALEELLESVGVEAEDFAHDDAL